MEQTDSTENKHLIRLTETDLARVALMAEVLGYEKDEYEVGVTDEHGGTEFVILPKDLPKAS